MFNINGNIENIFKLPLKIMVALCISSGLILFLPKNIIEKLYMSSFRDDFGFILGIIFIGSLTLPTALGIYWITSSTFTIFQNVWVERKKVK